MANSLDERQEYASKSQGILYKKQRLVIKKRRILNTDWSNIGLMKWVTPLNGYKQYGIVRDTAPIESGLDFVEACSIIINGYPLSNIGATQMLIFQLSQSKNFGAGETIYVYDRWNSSSNNVYVNSGSNYSPPKINGNWRYIKPFIADTTVPNCTDLLQFVFWGYDS